MSENQESTQKLIIAFDAKRLFFNYTGLGNYSRTLVRNLQAQYPEHEYHLFTPAIKNNEETAYFLDPEKFTIHTPEKWSPLWRTYGISSQINKLKPHIFHGLSHEIPLGIQPNIKKIVSFHDLIYEKYPEQFGWWDRNLYHLKYKNAVSRADHIVAISESTSQDLQTIYQTDISKISVIFQSCHERFQNLLRSEEPLPDSITHLNQYYLYVGSIIERKGLLQCVLAYAMLPKPLRKPFVVIGNGDKKYFSKVLDMIKYYQLEKYFHFVRGISNPALVTVYDQSFCLIYPSIYEGFGIPIIESLFRRKPVITSDISSLPEAAGPGAILVDPFSPKDIAQAMIWMNDQETYDTLSEKGYHYVTSKCSSENTAKEMMKLYGDIL